jgi:hypothetical protein
MRRLDVVIVNVLIVYRHDNTWLCGSILLDRLLRNRLLHWLLKHLVLILALLLLAEWLLKLLELLAVLRVQLRDILVGQHLRHIFWICLLIRPVPLICIFI